MGIKNLTNIIKKNSKKSIEYTKLNKLYGKTLSIDTSIFLYKYLYNDSDYLYCFLKQILKLLKNGIIPLYVFDGKPPEEKNELLNERRTKKQIIKVKIKLLKKIKDNNEKIINGEEINNNIDDIEYSNITKEMKEKIYKDLSERYKDNNNIETELNKQNKKLIYVTDKHINDLINMLDILGIPYLRTNNEAEIVCAQLNRHNIVNGCITEDSDYLTNGGNYQIRNFNLNNNNIILYKYHEILKDLDLNCDQFIDLCILYGCDYTTTIKGIGQIKGLKLIKQYKSIEGIIKYINNNNTNFIIPKDFYYEKARSIFKNELYTKKELKNIKKNIKLKISDIDKINKLIDNRAIVIKEYYIKEINNLHNYYNKIIKYKKKKKQQKLTNYFNPIITEPI